MAVENIKSTSITNRDASPPVLADVRLNQAVIRTARGVCLITTTKDVLSTYSFFEVPSRAVPVSLRISSPDIGTTTTLSVGLYKRVVGALTAVDVDLFAALYSVKDGAVAKIEILRQATTVTVANSEKALWQLAAATTDPAITYEVVATLDGGSDASGSVLLEMDYTV